MATLDQKVDEVFDQLDNLNSLCDIFFVGQKFTIYKSISAILRLLLPGSSGQVGLVQEVLPAGTLSRLRKVPDSAVPDGFIMLPARAVIEEGEAKVTLGNGIAYVKHFDIHQGALGKLRFEEIFDSNAPGVPIVDWLEQRFLRPDWNLKKFINTVTNKDGGAHHDPNAAVLAMQQLGYVHWLLTAEIGRSVSPQLQLQLCATYPGHIRPVR